MEQDIVLLLFLIVLPVSHLQTDAVPGKDAHIIHLARANHGNAALTLKRLSGM